jgi:hypothetical protein
MARLTGGRKEGSTGTPCWSCTKRTRSLLRGAICPAQRWVNLTLSPGHKRFVTVCVCHRHSDRQGRYRAGGASVGLKEPGQREPGPRGTVHGHGSSFRRPCLIILAWHPAQQWCCLDVTSEGNYGTERTVNSKATSLGSNPSSAIYHPISWSACSAAPSLHVPFHALGPIWLVSYCAEWIKLIHTESGKLNALSRLA